jgi:hypothetical protein
VTEATLARASGTRTRAVALVFLLGVGAFHAVGSVYDSHLQPHAMQAVAAGLGQAHFSSKVPT